MPNQILLSVDQLVRISLVVFLTYWSLRLIHPFFGVLTWGFILAVALYPIYEWLRLHFGGRKSLSAIIITAICLIVVVGSLVLLSNNMYSTVTDLSQKIRTHEQIIPEPPSIVKDWPIVGADIHRIWTLAYSNIGALVTKYSSYLLDTGKYLLGKTADISFDLLLFIIAILFSGYLLTKSDRLIVSINHLAKRIAPERGLTIVSIMKETIQNVSRGVIGLSFFQALVFGLLLLIAGMPGAGIISFIALIMGIAQLGLIILVIPVVAWLFFTKTFLFALLITIPLCLDALLDNFLKPFILARGLRTPMLVIFIGVIGGVLSHGVIGIFIGPVILAIFYDLVNHWLQQ